MRKKKILCSVLLSILCWSGPSSAQGGPDLHYGLNTTPKSAVQDIQNAKALGIDTLRVVVWWQHLEPAPGRFVWDKLDQVIDQASSASIQILLQIMPTSDWGVEKSSQQRGSYHSASMPKDLAQWEAFMGALSARYKGRGVHYEIANEVNAEAFWSGTLEQYTGLLKSSYAAIKKQDPNAMVVPSAMGCGISRELADTPTGQASLKKQDEYLLAILKTRAFDVVNIHNYYYPSDIVANTFTFRSYLEHVAGLMKEAGVGGKAIWITEIGFVSRPTQAGKRMDQGSPEKQARWLEEAYTQASSLGVKRIFWLLIRDRQEAFFGSMGLSDSKGNKRLAWSIMKRITGFGIREIPSDSTAAPSGPSSRTTDSYAASSGKKHPVKKALSVLKKIVQR
jgi:hypothetical protein